MRLNLIDRRHNVDVAGQVDKVIGIKVAHAYGAQLALSVGILECPVGSVAVAEWLMKKYIRTQETIISKDSNKVSFS